MGKLTINEKQFKREGKMMKKKGRKFFVFVAILAGMMLFSGVVLARPIELSLNLIIPPKHLRNINVLQPWVKMI